MIVLSKEVAAALVGAIIGSVVSFVLLVAWDVYKDRQRERTEQARAIRLVREEVETNLELLPRIREKLFAQENEDAKQNKQLIDALPQLPAEAWQAAWLAANLPDRSRFHALARTYRDIVILNQRIQARELFKASNQALTQFSEHVTLLNESLMGDIDKIIAALTKHRAELEEPK